MKKIAIFGASPYGRFVRLMLDEKRYVVKVFIDNGEMQNLDGVPVVKPENISEYDVDLIVIAVAQYKHEMEKQLVKLGIDKKKIVTFLDNPHGELDLVKDTRIAYLKLCMNEIRLRNIGGSMAELGVNKGDFAKYMNGFFPEKPLYLFDTFSGFDSRDLSEKDERIGYDFLFKDTNVDIVLNKMINPDSCIIKKGWFPDTLEDMPDEQFCLISLDADIFQPMYSGLKYFYPRLLPGGFIFVHDFNNGDWRGVRKAVTQFCDEESCGYVPVLDRCGSVIITK